MKLYILSTILFLSFFLAPAVVFSQENENEEEKEKEKDTTYQIEELTITGTRTTKRIIDIPYSVYRVDKDELTYGKKVSAKDLLQDVPGLFLQTRYGGSDLRISLRGYGTRSNTGIRGIKILQDGVPVSDPDGQTVADEIDFNNLGGVEVVKGNISSLYSNAPGGVINFISDLYFPENFFKTSNQVGSFGMKQTDERLGIKTDNYRFSLSYNYKNIDGYRPHSNEYSNLVNSVYEAYIGKKATLDIMGNYVRSIVKMAGSLTQSEYNSNPLQADSLAVAQDVKRDTKKGRLAVRFKSFFGKGERNEIEITGFGGIKELESPDLYTYTVSNRYTAGSFIRFRNQAKLFKRDNDFNMGFDYTFQSGPTSEFGNIGGHKGEFESETEDVVGNYGIYFYDQYNLIKKKMDLFISGRFDKFIYSRNEVIFIGIKDTTRIFQQFTPKIALNYKLTKDVALYTSYGLGFDVPAVSELDNYIYTSNPNVTLNPDLKPQKSSNFELGLKGNIINKRRTEWFRKALFDFTFFNYNIDDDIIPYNIGSGITYYRNAAKTNRTGVELGLESEPLENFELTVNYIFTRFKYKQYDALVLNQRDSAVHQDYSNNVMPSYPSNMVNFILTYEYEISEKINGILQFDCDYATKMFVDDKNSQSTSPYFTSNPMAGININVWKVNILGFLGVNNIFNRRYVGFININDFYGKFYETGEQRNIYCGLNISYKY